MGFFSTMSTSFRARKIANKISKSSTEIINELITRGIHIKTHDSIEIIMHVMNNYLFTEMMALLSQSKSKEDKDFLIGTIKNNMVELSSQMLSPAIDKSNYKTHEAMFMNPNGRADESFKEWISEWKQNFSGLTEINFEIEENTSTILIHYLNEKLDLDLSQSTFFKNFIFENLKNNML